MRPCLFRLVLLGLNKQHAVKKHVREALRRNALKYGTASEAGRELLPAAFHSMNEPFLFLTHAVDHNYKHNATVSSRIGIFHLGFSWYVYVPMYLYTPVYFESTCTHARKKQNLCVCTPPSYGHLHAL